MAISDESWWRRLGSPDEGFRNLKVNGEPLISQAALARIERLRIPPAWQQVHISPDANRKIQAWGEDSEGRRQYIYSEGHVRARDRRKWRRLLRLGRVLPRLRARVNEDLARPGLERDTVLALVVRFIDQGFFRVGSERYAVENRTYGIATLRKSQVEVRDGMLVFSYRGKQRKDIRRVVVDEEARRFIERLLGLRGRRLFQYSDGNGGLSPVRGSEVNRYLKESAGRRFTSKDLRTFGATVRAATILADLGPPGSEEEARKNVVLCCRLVSQELGNTRQVCRQAYIHPDVLESYLEEGRTIEGTAPSGPPRVHGGKAEPLSPEEEALIAFLRAAR